MMSKIFTCRFILSKDTEYKDLETIFPDILRYILEENEHLQEPEDEEMREMFIELNMQDIRENRKPEGYNRKAKYRLIFPEDSNEFYVKQMALKNNDIKRIGSKIGEFLSAANIKYETKFDYTVDCIPGSEGLFSISDHNTEIPFPSVYEYGKVLHANIKIKKEKKGASFGYMTNGVFHKITVTGPSFPWTFEICDDISFGYQ